MSEEKKQRGGSRVGAGRPVGPPSKPEKIRLLLSTWAQITSLSRRLNITQRRVIEQAVAELDERTPSP